MYSSITENQHPIFEEEFYKRGIFFLSCQDASVSERVKKQFLQCIPLEDFMGTPIGVLLQDYRKFNLPTSIDLVTLKLTYYSFILYWRATSVLYLVACT